MSRVIYKYPLPGLGSMAEVEVHRYAKALHVGLDPNDVPCIWFEEVLEQPMEERTLLTIGTGIAFEIDPKTTNKYIGTFSVGPFVAHIYQLGGSS